MASGVQVNDSCKDLCQQVKMNLKGKCKLRYAVFKISDDFKQIVVDAERAAPPGLGEDLENFEEVVAAMPTDDGRYLVYDYPYEGSFGKTSKIILVMWCPQGLPVKKRMLYASSKDALKKSLSDVGSVFEADCAEDLNHGDIVQKLRKV